MVFFLDLVPGNPGVTITAAIAVVMALWWVTEALPRCNQFVTHYSFSHIWCFDGKVFQTHINYVIFLLLVAFMAFSA
jgi:sodium-dependent dicarboxylate transporter 2/3/5